jgi:hypothetical protein
MSPHFRARFSPPEPKVPFGGRQADVLLQRPQQAVHVAGGEALPVVDWLDKERISELDLQAARVSTAV